MADLFGISTFWLAVLLVVVLATLAACARMVGRRSRASSISEIAPNSGPVPRSSPPRRKIGGSVYLVGAGIGIIIYTLIFEQDVSGEEFLALILIGSGTIWGIVETIKGTAHSCGCIGLMLFGLIAFIIYWFFSWLPGPI